MIIEHWNVSRRLDHVEQELNNVRRIIYENEYNQLCFTLSTPLRSFLVKEFRVNQIKVDPVDQALLMSLRADDYSLDSINQCLFDDICKIYRTIANELAVIDYKNLIEIMISQVEQARS
jgi:hypothetical protein